MTAARTFGRKGGALPQPAPQTPASDLDARRTAFVEAERQRRDTVEEKPEPVAKPAREPRPGDRTPGTAYGLWLFMGMVGAHRHYLGLHLSAVLQSSLAIIGLATLLVDARIGFAAFGLFTAWLAIDAAMIPILCRQANQRADDKRAFAGL